MTEPNLEEEARKKEREAFRQLLQGWYACVKSAVLYAPDHPSVTQACQKFVSVLEGIFRHKIEINIQHPDGLFLVENEYMIEESLAMYDILRLLEELKIGRIAIFPGVTEEDMRGFLLYLLKRQKGGTEGANDTGFSSGHLRAYVESGGNELTPMQKKGARIGTARRLYEEWLKRIDETFTKLLDEQSLSLFEVAGALDPLLDAVDRDAALFSFLVTTRRFGNLHVKHSLNSMILSIYLAQQLDVETNVVKAIAISALFHDVGRLLLPSDFKTGFRMNAHDAEIVHLHCRDGASFLAGVPGLPMAVVRTALEHHIGADGHGYPALPAGHKPHFYSQVVGLADFLSWGTLSDAYYHRPAPPHRLIRSVMHRSGTQFDPLLVKLVLPFYGIYPPGTVVRLSTGQQAVGLEANLRNITRPSVAVVQAGVPGQFLWLGEVKEKPDQPFVADVTKALGQDHEADALFELIPNLVATQSLNE